MLDSLKLIGEMCIKEGKIIDVMIGKIDTEQEKHLIKIIFDLDKKDIKYDWKELNENTLKNYKWIGHTFNAANEPVARLTFKDLKYLYNDKHKDNHIINNVIKSIDELNKKGININKYQKLYDYLTKIQENFALDKVKEKTNEYIQKEKLKAELFTICVCNANDTIDLARMDEYWQFIQDHIKYPTNIKKGICHVCGKETDVFADTAFKNGTILKIYNVDKKGFTSGISKNDESRLKTFAICPDCRFALILGTMHVENRLYWNLIEDINVFVIPTTNNYNEEDMNKLKNFLKPIIRKVEESTSGHEKLEEIDEAIERRASNEFYELNIIFGHKGQADFKIYDFVQEVPITNLTRFRENSKKINDKYSERWNGSMELTFHSIANLYRYDDQTKKSLIELLSAICKLEPYSISKLIEVSILIAKTYRYNLNKQGNSDSQMVDKLVKFNYLILLLKELGMISSTTQSVDLEIDDKDMKSYISEMNYNEPQTALFLLGYLVAQVGGAQYNKGDTKKSILDKVDFKGMKKERIMMLSCSIYESLRNYDINQYNEKYYCMMKKLLDKVVNDLDKDPLTNLFYILSGYAYGTCMIMQRGNQNE